MQTHRCIVATAWGGMLLGLWMGASASAQDVAPPSLFQPSASFIPAAALPSGVRAVRQRPVEINPDVLAQLLDGRLKRTRLPFFEDATMDFIVTSSAKWGDSTVILQGQPSLRPRGAAILVRHKGLVSLTIQAPNAPKWRLESLQGEGPGGPSFVALEEAVDPTARCGNTPLQDAAAPLAPAAPPAARAMFEPASAAETWVDVAIFYTDVARAAMGGTTAIELHILTANAFANLAHGNSDTRVRLRVVHLSEVAYNESGDLGDHLDRLQGTSDNVMDSVHAIRDTVGADLVHLFVADSGSGTNAGVIGLAYTPGQFGVSQIGHNYVYAHEVGHNLGCNHELFTTVPPTTYNHAIRITETWDLGIGSCQQSVTTVMYSTTGSIIPYFSNPNRTYIMGQDSCCGLGEAACTDTPRPVGTDAVFLEILPVSVGQWADNARYLRENRSATATNRQPAFYVQAGASDGEATKLSPENDLPEVFNEWYPKTEVSPSQTAVVRLRPGTYPGNTRMTEKTRLEKWDGAGSVRITQ